MVVKQRKRPRIGDVVRIDTPDGSAFAQYTHKHPEFGALVRVIGPGAKPRESTDPTSIAEQPTQFVTFFPLGAACHRGIATIVGSAPIPDDAREFPRFRQAMRLDPSDKSSCNWLIWNGEDEWVVSNLTPEQQRYPLREIVNDTLLVQRALEGWRSELEM